MSDLIMRNYNAITIYQRRNDRYLHATAMCQANGKVWHDYWRLQGTQEFVEELAAVTGNPATELIQVRQGGRPEEQGTWVHPRVAIHLAQWCSARFAVAVSGWVEDLMTTGTVSLIHDDPLIASMQAHIQLRQQQLLQQRLLEQTRQQVAQVDTKLAQVEGKVQQIEARKEEAEEALLAAERSDMQATPKSTRSKLNQLVRHFVINTGAEYYVVWDNLYRELRYRKHFDAKARTRKGKNSLDVVQEAGLIEELYAIASETLVVEA